MSDGFNWTCPVCGSHTTITSPNVAFDSLDLITARSPDHMGIKVDAQLIDCPNPECRSQAMSVAVHYAKRIADIPNRVYRGDVTRPVGIGAFTFLPTTSQPLSNHVPAGVASDYAEASLIKTLSPKASATLARRALQGMVRDFFGVKGLKTLHHELEAIKDRCDPALYEAMMAVKSVGNIGAHPEQDINLIVEVEPGEPETLLELIHLLDKEWYVDRANRQARIAKMKALGDAKAVAKAGAPLASLAGPSAPSASST